MKSRPGKVSEVPVLDSFAAAGKFLKIVLATAFWDISADVGELTFCLFASIVSQYLKEKLTEVFIISLFDA